MSRSSVALLVVAVAFAVGALAYTAGVAAGRAAPAAGVTPTAAQPAQAQGPFTLPDPFLGPQQGPDQQPLSPPTIREFIPIPGPGDQQPGQRPNQQGDCEPIILFYHNGQLYQLRPGQGPQNGPGRPGAPPEFFYLNPYQGPPIPGLPQPSPDRGPGFSPVNPRS